MAASKKGKAGKKGVRRSAPKPVKEKATAPAMTFPATVHVKRGGDRIPVQVTSAAHLERLRGEHGADAVEA
jgi:hypothetical protein